MSGDLKNPSKSLPLGTLGAVLVGFLIYLAIPLFLWKLVPAEVLRTNPMIMMDVSRVGGLILLGIWGATLSSALGALLGAPRTLQALARDRVVPSFLGAGSGPGDEPRIATAVAFFVGLGGLLLGDLNAIAPVLSMFFLTSYGILNFSAGFEGLIGNPSWRPKFRTPWILSLVGAGACFSAMLMIDAGATYGAVFFCGFVYWVMRRRQMKSRWGDVRRSLLLSLARFAIYRLKDHEKNARSWRPHILVLSGSPTSRWYLIQLAHAFGQRKSFLTVASILPRRSVTSERVEGVKSSIREFLEKQGVPALVDVHLAESTMAGAKALIENYGVGPLVPNTILLGETERKDNFVSFAELIALVCSLNRNLVVVREAADSSATPESGLFGRFGRSRGRAKRIDLWWGGDSQNASLMLGLAYMLQRSAEWRQAQLIVRSLVKNEEEREGMIKHLTDFLIRGRLAADLDVRIIDANVEPLSEISRYSKDADLVFLGIRKPNPDQTAEDYSEYYGSLLKDTEALPATAFVLAGEKLKFEEIFS